MLPTALRQLVETKTPQLNPLLAQGLASTDVRHPMEYIDATLKDAAKGFPKGVTYDGYRYLSPNEEFHQVAAPMSEVNGHKQKAEPKMVDLRRNDMRMVELMFSYNGKRLEPRYMQIPYSEQYGLIYISGSRWAINPVLADSFPSISKNTVFVRLLKAKITFRRLHAMVLVDGQQRAAPVVHGAVFNDKESDQAREERRATSEVSLKSSMVHYLMIKYGFTQTCERYLKLKVGRDIIPIDAEEAIGVDLNEWVIYSLPANRPRTYSRNAIYVAPPLAIMVKRAKNTDFVFSMMAGVLYIASHFSSRINKDTLDQQAIWSHTFGYTLFGTNSSIGVSLNKVKAHIESLDAYLESGFISDIKVLGYEIENIYDLFALVIEKFDYWLNISTDTISSVYGKQLQARYYACYDITYAIYRAYFTLISLFKKSADRVITENDINKVLREHLKRGTAYKITSGQHGAEITNANAVGDNYIFNITSNLVRQALTSPRRSRREDQSGADQQLDASIAQACGYANLPKADTSGRAKLNLDLMIGPDRKIYPNPKFKDLIDKTQKVLRINR
jgi:hypothetical protein